MICIVGAGKMGKALATGFIASDVAPENLTLVDRDQNRHADLQRDFPGVNLSIVPITCDGAVVATKPDGVPAAAAGAARAGAARIVSIAAGVPLAKISAHTGGVPVARAMPNVGVLVGASTTGICATDEVTQQWAGELMSRVGTVVFAQETDFDVVTALGGSGPAFIALAAEALIEAGTREGLDESVAAGLVTGMIESAMVTMKQRTMSPSELRKMVSTPGGTTLAGLDALEANDARAVFGTAVTAAVTRSKELAQ